MFIMYQCLKQGLKDLEYSVGIRFVTTKSLIYLKAKSYPQTTQSSNLKYIFIDIAETNQMIE